MVVVYMLTKSTHFVLVKPTYKASNIANIYMKEVDILHGILREIVLDRDSKFTSNSWKGLFKEFGPKFNFIIAYHP